MNPVEALNSFIPYLVAFVPMLGILILVHELGHFLVAKYFGVRVLKFSIGFGSPIGVGRLRMRWTRNGTEYVVAWIPLGGYVKMLGEQLHDAGEDEPDVPDARPDEYLNAKPVWQKLCITFAGPAMNLLLPVLIFMGVFAWGIQQPVAIVGTVEIPSPASDAGVQPGDRLLAVDGDPVVWWYDVAEAIREKPTGVIALEIERGDRVMEVPIERSSREGMDPFGAPTDVGWIGLEHRRLPALVGVPDGKTAAARAGLQSGDLVVEVDSVPVEDWEGLRAALGRARGRSEILVKRGSEGLSVSLTVPANPDLAAWGVVPATILVSEVTPGLPADRAGIKGGDLLLAVDGQPAGSFAAFASQVRTSRGRPLLLTVAREGSTRTLEVVPEKTMVPGPLGIEGMEEETYLIGIRHALPTLVGATAIDREFNPLVSFPRAVERTWEITGLFMTGLGKLVTGEVGTDKLAGPIGIAEIARKSLDTGWLPYIQTLIFISINLGILNLLPIPILDGGQALLYAIEGIQRSPLSVRTREIVQSVGLTMLLMLMGLAFWNDLSRHWNRFVEWLSAGL